MDAFNLADFLSYTDFWTPRHVFVKWSYIPNWYHTIAKVYIYLKEIEQEIQKNMMIQLSHHGEANQVKEN